MQSPIVLDGGGGWGDPFERPADEVRHDALEGLISVAGAAERYGVVLHPRTMDIDIVLAEDRVIHSEDLTIPHKEMHKRKFVLIPLNEIAPSAIHPILNREITDILSHTNVLGQVNKI